MCSSSRLTGTPVSSSDKTKRPVTQALEARAQVIPMNCWWLGNQIHQCTTCKGNFEACQQHMGEPIYILSCLSCLCCSLLPLLLCMAAAAAAAGTHMPSPITSHLPCMALQLRYLFLPRPPWPVIACHSLWVPAAFVSRLLKCRACGQGLDSRKKPCPSTSKCYEGIGHAWHAL